MDVITPWRFFIKLKFQWSTNSDWGDWKDWMQEEMTGRRKFVFELPLEYSNVGVQLEVENILFVILY